MQENHGGNIYKAIREYGVDSERIIDFSANINPLGIPNELKEIILNNIDSLKNYPDPECAELRSYISKYMDINSDEIIIGNGASEIIFLLFEILKPGKVLIPAPSFSEYGEAAGRAEAVIEYFRLEEDDGFRLNTDRLLESVTDDINAVMLCNPNNPTSTLINRDDLVRFIEYMNKKGVYVIIDEAFIELTALGNTNSVCSEVAKFENLFVIRAFTKIFAVPGIRMGYGIGNRELIKKMWKRKLPWSVNTFACYIGKVLDNAAEYLRKTSEWIREETNWFYNELCEIEDLKVFKPETNFVLIKILNENLNSKKIRDMMASRGILIRDASNFLFLNGKFFRIAIKERESNLKLLNELYNLQEITDNHFQLL